MASARDVRLQKALLNQQRQRESVASAGGGGGNFDSAGPPNWNRAAWEGFKAAYGHYPYGSQGDGSVLYPPSFAGCPAWAYELMGLRVPPVDVTH